MGKFKIKLMRKAKGLIFLMRLDYLLPGRLFHFLANISDLSKWISRHKNNPYSDFYNSNFEYANRYKLYEYLIENYDLDNEIDYLEFGVSKGVSFRWWMERIAGEQARFYGFDTFSGLPEDWGHFKKGDMNNGSTVPEIEGDRHSFYQGLFQQTLVPFLKDYKSDRRKVIHMDADIYSATLYVLTLITPYLRSGDILIFDEFNVPMHEYRAFKEWSDAFYIEYEVLGSVNNFYQVAITIN